MVVVWRKLNAVWVCAAHPEHCPLSGDPLLVTCQFLSTCLYLPGNLIKLGFVVFRWLATSEPTEEEQAIKDHGEASQMPGWHSVKPEMEFSGMPDYV